MYKVKPASSWMGLVRSRQEAYGQAFNRRSLLVAASLLGLMWGHGAAADTTTSLQRLHAVLQSMGYRDIHVSSCRLVFSRNFDNSCPTDRMLSYTRVLEIGRMTAQDVTPITFQPVPTGGLHEFHVLPTKEYRSDLVEYFIAAARIRQLYPDAGWPWRQDRFTPMIAEYLRKGISPDASYHWLYSTSCYGDGALVEEAPSFSYPEEAPLGSLRDALLDVIEEANCEGDET